MFIIIYMLITEIYQQTSILRIYFPYPNNDTVIEISFFFYEWNSSEWKFSIKKKNFLLFIYLLLRISIFFLKWIVFSFSFQFYKKFYSIDPSFLLKIILLLYDLFKRKKKKKNRSLTSIVSHQYAFSFHKKPVCNLIKREVSKSTKESSIDLCNSSPNAASIFSLHFSTSARKKFDCPDWCTEMQKNKEIVDLSTHAHTRFICGFIEPGFIVERLFGMEACFFRRERVGQKLTDLTFWRRWILFLN